MVIVFVDTSALIALLDADDTRHTEARATLEWLRAGAELVTTNYVEIEAVAVAHRRLGRDAAARLVDALFPLMRVLWVDELIHTAGLAAYRTTMGSASVVDRVSFTVMRANAIDIAFAYDADFQREGFKTGQVPPQAFEEHQVHEEHAQYDGGSISDVVSVAEISMRAGRSVNTIQSWRRRHADFPTPLAELAAGPIWSWPTVADWIASRSSPRRP